MSLEFEKLVGSLDSMAQSAAMRHKLRSETATEMAQTLERYAEDWPAILAALDRSQEEADPKLIRSARPVSQRSPMNATIEALRPPERATIIATDGSQIMPDRHAAHLYYVINVGGIIYHHGREEPDEENGPLAGGPAPEPFSYPDLFYPANDREAAEILTSGGLVSIKRDLKEIETLADMAWEYRHAGGLLLAMLDQRLLYWPVSREDSELKEPLTRWLSAITKVHDSGAVLSGYIDRPLTSAVITLLVSLRAMEDPDFDWKALGQPGAGGGLSDATLFSGILGPGQRSIVFAGVSQRNEEFARGDPDNEVCFFYLNPGQSGRRIARVDIPMWVARDEAKVSVVHALIADQCRILGDYPYVLARADEMAVIGRQDHEELDFMVDLYMQRHGVEGQLTGKQGSKGLARGGKTRHRGL